VTAELTFVIAWYSDSKNGVASLAYGRSKNSTERLCPRRPIRVAQSIDLFIDFRFFANLYVRNHAPAVLGRVCKVRIYLNK
jgi:hypothetical protein